jgi:hypothetical protein
MSFFGQLGLMGQHELMNHQSALDVDSYDEYLRRQTYFNAMAQHARGLIRSETKEAKEDDSKKLLLLEDI